MALTNVFVLGGQRSAPLCDKLECIQTDLNDVVQEGKQRGQREGRHKNGGEAKLQN